MDIPDERLDRAMNFLATSDLEFAARKAMVLRTEFMAKHVEALTYKAQTEGGVEDKKMTVRTDLAVLKAWDAHFDAVRDYENLKAQRERQVIVVELWRSVQANRRVGNVR